MIFTISEPRNGHNQDTTFRKHLTYCTTCISHLYPVTCRCQALAFYITKIPQAPTQQTKTTVLTSRSKVLLGKIFEKFLRDLERSLGTFRDDLPPAEETCTLENSTFYRHQQHAQWESPGPNKMGICKSPSTSLRRPDTT